MIRGVGVDIVKTERIKKAIHRNQRFVGRVFTSLEQEYCLGKKRSHLHFAARFAAKEAAAKALGTGISGFGWRDLEICRGTSGEPFVSLKGEALKKAQERKVDTILVSLSVTDNEAIAYALALGVK